MQDAAQHVEAAASPAEHDENHRILAWGTSSSGTLGRARDGGSVRLTSRTSCRLELLPEVLMAAEIKGDWRLVNPVPGAGPSVHRPPSVALRIPHHEMKTGTKHPAILCGAL